VLTVADVDIGNDVYDTAIGFFWETFIEATIASFHVEDWNVEALGTDNTEAAVSVSKDEDGIWLCLHHKLVACVYNIAHGGAEVVSDCIHIYFGIL
jgi:hypothetical protein